MERDVLLDNTLARMTLDSQLVRIGPTGGRLAVGFDLAHAATVAVTIETPAGNVLRTVSPGQLQPGTQSVAWNGRNDRGKLVRGQRLVARVRATNSIGTVTLVAPFTARRVA
jgi:flagellar hook assembly protein FlgD